MTRLILTCRNAWLGVSDGQHIEKSGVQLPKEEHHLGRTEPTLAPGPGFAMMTSATRSIAGRKTDSMCKKCCEDSQSQQKQNGRVPSCPHPPTVLIAHTAIFSLMSNQNCACTFTVCDRSHLRTPKASKMIVAETKRPHSRALI